MSKIQEGRDCSGTGLMTQLKYKVPHKFEAYEKEQFDELIKVMNYMEEEKKKEDKLKEELRNIKGPKKKLII